MIRNAVFDMPKCLPEQRFERLIGEKETS